MKKSSKSVSRKKPKEEFMLKWDEKCPYCKETYCASFYKPVDRKTEYTRICPYCGSNLGSSPNYKCVTSTLYYPLKRFIHAQAISYEKAKKELLNGKKTSCWIWYIFPQLKGLGKSWNSTYYGLDGEEEAKAYWEMPVLRNRLIEMSQILLDCKKDDIKDIVGFDDIKVQSCMELFYKISGEKVFKLVLEKYYG